MRDHLTRLKAGFSLVEMLITVAILGVLAAVAVPNYHKYTARARQGEAKNALLAIYGLMQTFHVDNGTYTNCLATMGFQPTGPINYYAVGSLLANASFANCGLGNPAPSFGHSCTAFSYNVDGSVARACNVAAGEQCFDRNVSANPSIAYTIGNCSTSGINGSVLAGSFYMTAEGIISNHEGVDVWSINENKTLLNTNQGI